MAKINLTLSYDTETFKVAMKCEGVTIGLGMMMCHEALEQLEESRHIALMQQLAAQANEDAIRRAIAGNAKTREV